MTGAKSGSLLFCAEGRQVTSVSLFGSQKNAIEYRERCARAPLGTSTR